MTDWPEPDGDHAVVQTYGGGIMRRQAPDEWYSSRLGQGQTYTWADVCAMPGLCIFEQVDLGLHPPGTKVRRRDQLSNRRTVTILASFRLSDGTAYYVIDEGPEARRERNVTPRLYLAAAVYPLVDCTALARVGGDVVQCAEPVDEDDHFHRGATPGGVVVEWSTRPDPSKEPS